MTLMVSKPTIELYWNLPHPTLHKLYTLTGPQLTLVTGQTCPSQMKLAVFNESL